MNTTTLSLRCQMAQTGSWLTKYCDKRVWRAYKQLGYRSNVTRSKWYEDAGDGDLTLSDMTGNYRLIVKDGDEL